MRDERLAAAYASADVFVFPSLTDTFGLVLLEALASGLPVAANPVVGPLDVIGDSGAGVLDANLGRAALAALSIPRELARARALTFSLSELGDNLSTTCLPRIGPPHYVDIGPSAEWKKRVPSDADRGGRARQVSTAMTKTDADRLRLLPDRRLGSFHRLRDMDHRRPRFRMDFELPQILFGPRFADRSCLFRHGFHFSLIDRDCIAAVRIEPID